MHGSSTYTKRIPSYSRVSQHGFSFRVLYRDVCQFRIFFLIFFLTGGMLLLYLYYSSRYVDYVYKIRTEREKLNQIREEQKTLGLDLVRGRSLGELETLAREIGMIEGSHVNYVVISESKTAARE